MASSQFIQFGDGGIMRQFVASSASEEILFKFDQLPNSAYVRLGVVIGLFACSRATVWRWVKSSIIPKPVKRGGITAWNVGELREAISKQKNGLEK